MQMPADEEPLVNIRGTLVALGPLRRDLLPDYHRWINDFEVLRTLGANFRPMSMEQESGWYDHSSTAEHNHPFTIYELSTWRPIGSTALMGIDHANRTAEFGIMIGEADCRGKGYGTEVTRLMLDYAFTALSLNSVMLTVAEYNAAGRRAYEKAGFQEIGRRRQCRMRAGTLYDMIYMDCVRTEFSSSVLASILVPHQPPR